MEKVLIVDDSILNLRVLTQILESEYEVVPFQEGTRLLEKTVQFQPSLILLDVIMREIGGFELLEQLKQDERTRDIPVIIITGLEGQEHEEYALECGAVDFIAKPFRNKVVKARVDTHVALYRYRKATERLALFDALTEIPNRRNFDNRLQALWSVTEEDQRSFSCGLCDIDFFKQYNDSYGHLAGDNTLRAVAQAIHQTLLPLGGFTARYGGEEFAILLPCYNAEQSMQTMELVRQQVASLAIPHLASSIAPFVTISVGGVLVTPAFTGSDGDVMQAADQTLYQAKAAGRNQLQWTTL